MNLQTIEQPVETLAPALPVLCETSVFYVPDRTAEARQAWLTRLDLASQPVRLKQDMICLPHVPEYAATFILHGEDPLRLLHFIKQSSDLLSDRIRIALCTTSMPEERALLLRGGFDDVFDLSMAPEEARARIHAMLRRRALLQDRLLVDESLKARIRACVHARPSPREYRLMALLVSREGRPVPVDELARYTGNASKPTSKTVLQTQICRLRKRLKPGHAIHSTYNGAYLFQAPSAQRRLVISARGRT